MAWFDLRAAIFSVNSFVAAMLALFISFSLGFERPFWAMATVYITSQPLSGAVRSKAVFRLVGTIVGAMATVLLVPPLVNAPVLLSIALALWVAGCQFVSLLDRTPRSYMFMLAGYTAALIGFPTVDHPQGVFDFAVLRALEIGIGVICAAIVHSISFPQAVTGPFRARAAQILREAEAWVCDALSAVRPDRTAGERRRLASDISELHVMATHIPFDTAAIRPNRALLTALQDRLVLLLPLVSAIEERLASLAALGPIDSDLSRVVSEVRALAAQEEHADASATIAHARALAERTETDDWAGMLQLNILDRLVELVESLGLARHLVDALAVGHLRELDLVPPRALHRDYGMAALSAIATVLAILICCAGWIYLAWPAGGGAPMIAAVLCCFFAMLDDPTPAQRSFFLWTAAALPMSGLYLFILLPNVHTFATLTLVLALTFLPLGYVMARPGWYGRMVPLMIGMAGSLALTNEFSADPVAFLNSNIAQLTGAGAAIAMTRLIRTIGAATAIERLRRASWRDLAALARRSSPLDAVGWRGRMVDRVGLIAARIGQTEQLGERDAAQETLRELRLGYTLSRIADVAGGAELRAAFARHFERLLKGGGGDDPVLLSDIDRAITLERARPASTDHDSRAGLTALAGLRHNIFPDAPAWVPQEIAA